MKTTMDRFGRIVVPKDIRSQLGLKSGTEMNIDEKGNSIVLKAIRHRDPLVMKEGVLVYSGKATGNLRGVVQGYRDAHCNLERK